MRARTLLSALSFAVVTAVTASPAQAQTETFGTGTNQFTMDFVAVGDAGNQADTNNRGAVSYPYRIASLEVTEAQMEMARANGLANVTSGAWAADQPAAFIHWFEAAAFVNFLNEQAGFAPAYNIAWNETNQTWTMEPWAATESWGAYGENRFRHRDSRYFLPSEDEWYKAAHYKGGATNAGYWAYPTAEDAAPTGVAAGTDASTAVFGLQSGPSEVAQSGGLSPSGTRGQGGNVAEWLESAWDGTNNLVTEARATRGGDWFGPANELAAAAREINSPYYENDMLGFRVASVTNNLFAQRLAVEAGGAILTNNAPAIEFTALRPGSGDDTRIYTVRNTGSEDLDNVFFTVTGPHGNDFTITLPQDGPLAVGASAEIEVVFAPTAGGDRNLQVRIATENPPINPFVINLAGYGLTQEFDRDNDGLNDAAEYGMSGLGFDFRVAQPDLVAGLLGNATFVPLYNETEVETERVSAFNQGLSAGTNAVVSDPGTYGLYNSNSIMDLNLGGVMIQRTGSNAVISVQVQSTPDLSTQAFTNHGTPVELPPMEMPGDKGFFRIRALGPQ
jgi:formylglycine-generating enzyme required for sulfatase activity